ncbi:FkbM family methyltransferase [Plectonema radiosum NIES-515]|uniref:FkbM family methyltransferase n=1 Tax=Plectonema radiosum NIES-515 TaxID=2986073 RepID=A0ABT3B0N3_9CYAN|nr:FkbM family methyltransferase [Plectonema radiosum]MCV3214938.1 FkbM family methyltransferase [Plectonema radiosum NIES-515]
MKTQLFSEYIKHLFIRTPLEKPTKKIRHFLGFRQRIMYPELIDIYQESDRTDKAMERIIGDSFNCIDIGCHLGSTLSTILNLAPLGHHIAIEPLPYKADWLKQKFPEVEVKELALTDTPGEVTFYFNTTQSAYSGLHRREMKNSTLQELTVKSEMLDTILPADHRVDFIKLDVEGGELAVLRGAESTLQRYRPVLLFECTQPGLSSFGLKPIEVFEFLTQKHSYSIFLLKDFLSDRLPLDFDQFDNALHYPFKAFNFIAVNKNY